MFLNVNIIQQCVSSYGGPGTQAVSEQWGIGWDTYLARLQKILLIIILTLIIIVLIFILIIIIILA